jgi:hypothetical protein
VAGEHHVVDARGGDVDRPVRRQLGGVHEDPGPEALRHRDDVAEGPQLTGDIGRAGHDDEPLGGHRRRQRRLQVL